MHGRPVRATKEFMQSFGCTLFTFCLLAKRFDFSPIILPDGAGMREILCPINLVAIWYTLQLYLALIPISRTHIQTCNKNTLH